MNRKEFHIGDVLSITTGRLVSPRKMEGVYDILNFMTGESLFTYQLPIAADEMRPHLYAQHPFLKDVVVPDEYGGDWVASWMADLIAAHGEMLPIESRDVTRDYGDPVRDAILLTGDPNKAIVVSLDSDDLN